MTKGDRYTKIVEWLVEEAIETLDEAGKPAPQPLSQHELGSLLQKQAGGLINATDHAGRNHRRVAGAEP
jgi:hypothetical protein